MGGSGSLRLSDELPARNQLQLTPKLTSVGRHPSPIGPGKEMAGRKVTMHGPESRRLEIMMDGARWSRLGSTSILAVIAQMVWSSFGTIIPL